MAYIADDKKKKDDDGSVNTSGIVNSTVTAGNNEEKPSTTPGSGFVNLAQYIDMNDNAGAAIASDINKGITNKADEYKNEAQNTKSTVTDSLNNKKTSFQNTAETIQNDLNSDASAAEETAKNFLGTEYNSNLGDTFANLGSKKDSVISGLNNVDDKGQITTNLKDTYAKTNGDYNTGFGILDRFLVQGTQSGRDKLQEIKGLGKGVEDVYSSTTKDLQDTENTTKQVLDNQKKAIRDKAKEIKKNIESKADEQAFKVNEDYKKNAGFRAASKGDFITDDLMSDLRALTDIAGENWNDYQKTFNQGIAPVAPLTPINTGVSDNNGGIVGGEEAKKINDILHPDRSISVDGAKTTMQDTWENLFEDPTRKTVEVIGDIGRKASDVGANVAGAVGDAAGKVNSGINTIIKNTTTGPLKDMGVGGGTQGNDSNLGNAGGALAIDPTNNLAPTPLPLPPNSPTNLPPGPGVGDGTIAGQADVAAAAREAEASRLRAERAAAEKALSDDIKAARSTLAGVANRAFSLHYAVIALLEKHPELTYPEAAKLLS